MIQAKCLQGKSIVVTGVSRRLGIGWAVAHELARSGAHVAAHGYGTYDIQMQYADAGEHEWTKEAHPNICFLKQSDIALPDTPEQIMREATGRLGSIDGLVINHAYSTHAEMGEWTATHIDAHLHVNVRAAMLLIQAFVRQSQTVNSNMAITLFTSGQYLGPMTGEMAYAVSKEAICCLTRQAAYALIKRNVRVNCINPGPTDTGYLFGDDYVCIENQFPSKRWGKPQDAARLVRFLHSDDAQWITGQIIGSEGGFERFRLEK